MQVTTSTRPPLERQAWIPAAVRRFALLLNVGLAFKLALTLLVLTGLTTGFIIWQTERDTYQLLLDIGRAQARAYLAGIELQVQSDAPDMDPAKLQIIIGKAVTGERANLDFRIEHLFVIDRQGRIIASNQPEHLGSSLGSRPYVVQALAENRMISPDGLTFRTPVDGENAPEVPTIDVVMPLHVGGAVAPVGSVELEMDLSGSAQILKKQYWDIRRDLLTKLGLLMVGFGVLSFVVLDRQVIRRLADMARVARSIAQGNLRLRLRKQGSDEIGALAEALNQMTDSLENTIVDLKQTQLLAMTKLAELAEKRDPDTGAHLERIPLYCRVLASALRRDSPYAALLDDEYVATLVESSPLHDIGKVGIPDRILQKPGRLSAEEFATMQRHTAIGADVLAGADFLDMARDMARHHHERYDGNGYPDGLSGDQIPLAARIVSVADMYDALTSRRVYKEAYTHAEAFALMRAPASHEQASAILAGESGGRFDPHVMQAFLQSEAEFKAIRERFADET